MVESEQGRKQRGVAEADGNRTRRGTLVPPLVLKTREPTRRSFASTAELTPAGAVGPKGLVFCGCGYAHATGTPEHEGMTAKRSDNHDSNGYRIMPGWRVGHLMEQSTTRSGLLVPPGTESTSDALALVDIHTGRRFWAVPTGAWRFLWPDNNRLAVAVRNSQIIAEEQDDPPTGKDSYL